MISIKSNLYNLSRKSILHVHGLENKTVVGVLAYDSLNHPEVINCVVVGGKIPDVGGWFHEKLIVFQEVVEPVLASLKNLAVENLVVRDISVEVIDLVDIIASFPICLASHQNYKLILVLGNVSEISVCIYTLDKKWFLLLCCSLYSILSEM